MIRYFTALRKTIFKNQSDKDIFKKATDDFNHNGARCPKCGAIGTLAPYGDYSRYLVSIENDIVTVSLVSPLRFTCASCKSTHALLPSILIPYSPNSLRFKLTVLIAYYERVTTVAMVCERFGIAISTLYKWKECLLKHKDLLLGILASRKENALAFLTNLFESTHLTAYLRIFYHQYAFSFLQNRSIAATCFLPP